ITSSAARAQSSALRRGLSSLASAVVGMRGDRMGLPRSLPHTLWYLQHADRAGVPVLLAHGFGQTRQSWGATQQRLAGAGHRSLAFDMRGHGASGRNAAGEEYAAAQFVDDLCAAAAT